ncbi:MAG: hypothetical protein EOO73_10160 [Myxococcales bacterium]|nr:MAG: hypothetical protein EOO73_10160 [Myxococcales bacterium]
MKRLLDEPASDYLTQRAHALIESVGATAPSEERARRIRRALDAAPARPWVRWAPRFGYAVMLVAAGAGAAGLGALGSQLTSSSPPAVVSSPAPAPPRAPAEPRANVAPRAPEEPLPPPPEPTPRSSARPAAARALAHVAPPPRTDVARVHEAARALSQDGDAARALSLLEREPVAPGSPLAEEALALRIRASTALRNGREGKLAKSYLALYPHGRYRELATRALAEGSR